MSKSHLAIGNPCKQALLQCITKPRDPARIFLQRKSRKFRGFAQPHDPRNILRARPVTPLVMPAKQKLPDLRSTLNEQRAHALRPVKLVARKRKQIQLQSLHIHRNFSSGLHRVSVKVNVGTGSDPPDFPKRLHRANLIIRVHHRDQRSLRPKRAANLFRINQPFAIHLQISDLGPLFLQRLAAIENRFVLDRCGDNVRSRTRSLKRLRHAENRVIVGLRAPAGKNDLRRACMNQRGHLFARGFHRRPRSLSRGVDRRGIAELPRKIRQHGLNDGRVNRSRGIVVQINPLHRCPRSE